MVVRGRAMPPGSCEVCCLWDVCQVYFFLDFFVAERSSAKWFVSSMSATRASMSFTQALFTNKPKLPRSSMINGLPLLITLRDSSD